MSKALLLKASHFLDHDLALALTQGAMSHSKIYFDHEKLVGCQCTEIKSKSTIKSKRMPGRGIRGGQDPELGAAIGERTRDGGDFGEGVDGVPDGL